MKISASFFGELRKFDPGIDWDETSTVAEIVSRVRGLELEPRNFIVSVNGMGCDLDTELKAGDKVIFAPMVMGG